MSGLLKKWPLFALGAAIIIIGISVMWFICFDSDKMCRTGK